VSKHVFASYLCCPEAAEEDRRVEKGKFWHKPEQFFIPLDELPDDIEATTPNLQDRLRNAFSIPERMAILFRQQPSAVGVVYAKAMLDHRQTIADVIPGVVRQLRTEGRLDPTAVKVIRHRFTGLADPVAREILAAVA